MSISVIQALNQARSYLDNGQLEKAKEVLESILQRSHRNIDALQLLGIVHATNGNFNQAIDKFSRALKFNPVNAQLLFNRANTYSENGQHHEALADIEKSLLINRNDYDSLLLHGFSCTKCGLYDKAIDSYDILLNFKPNDFKALVSKGHLLLDVFKHAEAFNIFEKLLKIYPNFPDSYFEYGNALLKLNKFEEACAYFDKAITINPSHADAYSNRGNALRKICRLHEALSSFDKSIAINPYIADFHNNRGNVLLELGHLKEAKESYQEAIRINPYYAEAYSNLIFSVNYAEGSSHDQTFDIAKRYGDLMSSVATAKFTSWHTDSNLNKLRIGFVSGDLRNHPVGYFLESLIEQLDFNQFDIFAFPTARISDDLTHRIRPCFKDWIPLYNKSDFEAASLIHKQKIHILIDLSGHTAHNRLPVFSYKPAPIQISYLGYFATTGMPEMDYFLGAPYMAPQEEEKYFTEKLCNISNTWLCLKPPNHIAQIPAAPVLKNGYITFGCFGNLTKMNDEVVKVWSEIISKIPGSKLLLKSNQLADEYVIADVRARFAKNGISDERLLLEGPSPRTAYFETYNRIDIVLDTFPYPGGTTSIDALWMGVPVLTLKGHRFLSRLGESIAINAGELAWVAENQSEYIDKAITFASDLRSHPMDRLIRRDKVLKTSLFDTRQFAQKFSETMLSIWESHKSEFE